MAGDGLRRGAGESAEFPTSVKEVGSSSHLILVAKPEVRTIGVQRERESRAPVARGPLAAIQALPSPGVPVIATTARPGEGPGTVRRRLDQRRGPPAHDLLAGPEVSPFYGRISSPVILIEFDQQPWIALDNDVPSRRHIHTVVRTPKATMMGRIFCGSMTSNTTMRIRTPRIGWDTAKV